MSNEHLVQHVSKEIALVVQTTVVFAKRANNGTQDLFCLRAIHITQNSEEFFVEQGCHIKSIHL